MGMGTGGSPEPRWRRLARELGASIGRSDNPICFLLGAGASLSSGGPTNGAVLGALREATDVRFEDMDLMTAISTLHETEKQEILAPLFQDISPAGGYRALASLAAYVPVVVLNLNWDDAMAQAATANGVLRASFDIADDSASWPALSASHGLYDIHLHGKLGSSCRYGTLETLTLPEGAEEYLVENGLAHVVVCIGASLNDEKDLPGVFRHHQLGRDPARPARHWYFVRGPETDSGEDRLRQALYGASTLHYSKGETIDFDTVATLIVDAAVAKLVDRRPGVR